MAKEKYHMPYNFFISDGNDKDIFTANSVNHVDYTINKIELENKLIGHNLFYYNLIDNSFNSNKINYNIFTENSEAKYSENAFLIINDEKKIFDCVTKLYPYIKTLNIKLPYFYNMDIDILKNQFEMLNAFLYEMYLDNNLKIIYQLTSFLIKEKFDFFGDNTFYISPDGYIWYHPMFYYNNDSVGRICHYSNFYNNDFNHISKPSIVCQACECFYCDRNIYWNKLETSEFKVPSKEECAKTTFLSLYSKLLFNKIFNSTLDPYENLDVCNTKLDFDIIFKKLDDKKVKVNYIKNIDLNYLRYNIDET